jgi:4'-phosphopantetheinyl transferase
MRCEVINIRTVSNDEYRDISARQSDELKKKLENCGEDDVKRTLAGRLLLERMIKRLYGKKRFEIKYNRNGKPLCDFCFFSISHSGDFAAVAVSDNQVGVDIQIPGGFKKREKYMLFSPAENEFVNAENSENRFYTLWTRKEAYIKAEGGTLSDAAKISLVCGGELKEKLGEYRFETEKTESYYLAVCCK